MGSKCDRHFTYPLKESSTVAWTLSTSSNDTMDEVFSKLPYTMRFGPRTYGELNEINTATIKPTFKYSLCHRLQSRTTFLQPSQSSRRKGYVESLEISHCHLHFGLSYSCRSFLDLLRPTSKPDQYSYHTPHLHVQRVK